MYLLCARKKQLKELGFTEAYHNAGQWYGVVITPAQYMLYILKFEESIDSRRKNDEKKSLIIYSDWSWAHQLSDWYNCFISDIEKNTIHLERL